MDLLNANIEKGVHFDESIIIEIYLIQFMPTLTIESLSFKWFIALK